MTVSIITTACVYSSSYETGTFTLILPANGYLVVIAEYNRKQYV